MNNSNKANLYQPIFADQNTPAPLVIRAVINNSNYELLGGVPSQTHKVENYVLISALPTELQEKVKLAIQVLISGR